MIKSFALKNYRGIREGHLSDFSSINIFIGDNGSGKTSVIEGLVWVGEAIQGAIDASPNEHNVACGKSLKNYEYLLRKRNQETGSMVIRILNPSRLRLAIPMDEFCKNIHVSGIPDKAVYFNSGDSIEFDVDGKVHFDINIQKQEGRAVFDLESPSCEFDKVEEFRIFTNILYMDSTFAFNHHIESSYLGELVYGGKKSKVIEHFNSIYSQKIDNFERVNDHFAVYLRGNERAIHIDNLGSGMRIALRMLILLALHENALVFMEELDAYQSPSSLRNIAKILCHFSRNANVQFFISTHSYDTLTSFQDLEDCSDIKVFPFLLRDGKLMTKALDYEYFVKEFSSGVDFRQMEQYIVHE